MTETSGRHAQKDKERQHRIESDIRWGLRDPDCAQARGRPAQDCGLVLLLWGERKVGSDDVGVDRGVR